MNPYTYQACAPPGPSPVVFRSCPAKDSKSNTASTDLYETMQKWWISTRILWMVLDCALPSEIQSRTLLSITGAVVISAGKSGREERSSISAKFHKGQSVDCVKITTYTRCIVMYRYRTWLLLCLSYPRIHWLTSARTIIVFFQSCCSLRHVYWRNQ